MQKRDRWFRQYQEIPGLSEGMRKLASRTQHFQLEDISGRSVLDLGSNTGQMAFWAAEQGAARVLGIEYDSAAFELARRYRDALPHSAGRVRFKLDDLDNPCCWHHLERHETTFLLSLIDTKELENRDALLAKACMKTTGVLYLEGHLKQPHVKYMNQILTMTDFTRVCCRGQHEGRHFFRCSREVMDTGACLTAIRAAAARGDRIAITGNQLAGKSTLLKQLGPLEGYTILDDCADVEKLRRTERLLLADYRAAHYLDDFDVVFHLVTPPGVWEEKRSSLPWTRSSPARPWTRLREFYTVAARTA
jgi:SAM-dependent methyltransferase